MNFQMYRTFMGHMEGDVRPIYFLVTDMTMYILTFDKDGQKKYKVEAATSHRDLDYISVRSNTIMTDDTCLYYEHFSSTVQSALVAHNGAQTTFAVQKARRPVAASNINTLIECLS